MLDEEPMLRGEDELATPSADGDVKPCKMRKSSCPGKGVESQKLLVVDLVLVNPEVEGCLFRGEVNYTTFLDAEDERFCCLNAGDCPEVDGHGVALLGILPAGVAVAAKYVVRFADACHKEFFRG